MTETEVQSAIESGASTRDDVTRACKAGGDCGACHGMIETMIEDHVETQAEASGPVRCRGTSPNERLVAETSLVRTRAA